VFFPVRTPSGGYQRLGATRAAESADGAGMPGAPPGPMSDINRAGMAPKVVGLTEASAHRKSKNEQYATTNTDLEMTLIREENGNKLWLGNAEDAEDPEKLKRAGITHILNCADDVEPPGYLFAREFSYLLLEIEDSPLGACKLKMNLSRGIKFIDKGLLEGNVLVHCHSGRSRSASFVIAFLMTHRGSSYTDALELLKQKHRLYGGDLVEPNDSFKRVLQEFAVERETQVRESIARSRSRSGSQEAGGFMGSLSGGYEGLASGYKGLIGMCCGSSQDQA